MHKTKKFNTGMHEYLRDLFRSLIKKQIMGKIRKTDYYLTHDYLNIENEDNNLISTEHTRNSKVLKIFFSEYNSRTCEYDSHDHVIFIYENGEIHFQEVEFSATYLNINNQEDVFNLAIQYDIYYSYEDLLFLKRQFKKLIKRRNVSTVCLYYAKGEEKEYGY